MISLFDLILILIIFGFVWFGFWYGLIYSLGSIVGVIVGALGAGKYYLVAAGLVSDHPGNFLKVVAFILLFGLINKLIGVLFWLIDKIFNILSIIPFLKTINRLAGATLGLLEGILALGLVLYIYTKYPFSEWINSGLALSQVSPKLLSVTAILKPFLPEALKMIKGVI